MTKFLKIVAERTRDSRRRSRDRRLTVEQFISMFQQKCRDFEKSRWTVRRQWFEVTRPSADCQTTFLWRFKQFGKILIKVAERSRDSGRRSRDRWLTVKQRYFDVPRNPEIFWKKSLNGPETVVRGHVTVDRKSNNLFDVSSKSEKFWEKSLNGHATVVGGIGGSRDRRLTVKLFQCRCYLTGRILHQYACNSVSVA